MNKVPVNTQENCNKTTGSDMNKHTRTVGDHSAYKRENSVLAVADYDGGKKQNKGELM